MTTPTPILSIRNLSAQIDGKPLLRDLSLDLLPGRVHAIMGPNGAGKSSLSQILAGNPLYEPTGGSVQFLGRDLLAQPPEERAQAGLFLGFQYPIEIPGVNTTYFLRTAFNARRAYIGLPELDAFDFLSLAREHMRALDFDESFLSRSVNEGFSGGERKRHEMLQMRLLEPVLAILDEPDSGLDVDALQLVAASINHQRRADRTVVLITHYQRLLDLVEPDHVHILAEGRIACSGDASLARSIGARGYEAALTEAEA
jgi:Fe-S cluster assembly ATP-binding protein